MITQERWNNEQQLEPEPARERRRSCAPAPAQFGAHVPHGDLRVRRRVGAVIAERGGLPPSFVLATKVDPDPRTGDYSGDRARRSAEESLQRLGVSQFQLLYLHDPEVIRFEEAMAPGGPVEALVELRRSGAAQYIGVAGGPVDLMTRFVRTGVFDVLLTHNRFTLVDRTADQLITELGPGNRKAVRALRGPAARGGAQDVDPRPARRLDRGGHGKSRAR